MELIGSAATEFERVVRQLPADSWDRPTPSDFWVHELVEQILVRNCFTALLITGERDQGRITLAGDQLGDDLVTAVVELARGQVEAFAATPPDQIVAGPVK